MRTMSRQTAVILTIPLLMCIISITYLCIAKWGILGIGLMIVTPIGWMVGLGLALVLHIYKIIDLFKFL